VVSRPAITVLDLIAARETAASAALEELHEQQAKLAAEVAAIESKPAGQPAHPDRDPTWPIRPHPGTDLASRTSL
jgi:hypothetical protein